MAADEPGTEGLQPHPLIDKLAQFPGVQALSGYLARDPQPGYWRIYEDLNLNTFYSVAESDIVGSQQLATDQEPLRPTIVWVKQDAVLQYTRIESRQAQAASFLQGNMMSGFMRGTIGPRRESRMTGMRARQARHARGAEFEASVDWCVSVDFCRTPDYGACFTRPAYCRSEFYHCPSDFCPSEPACPTDVFCDTYEYQLC
jgi:hypothetical protein